jgi:hypothetical protein
MRENVPKSGPKYKVLQGGRQAVSQAVGRLGTPQPDGSREVPKNFVARADGRHGMLLSTMPHPEEDV